MCENNSSEHSTVDRGEKIRDINDGSNGKQKDSSDASDLDIPRLVLPLLNFRCTS